MKKNKTKKNTNLVLEVVIEVFLLFLSPDHIKDLAILRQAGWAVGVTVCIALKAVLVKGMTAQEVHRRKF